MTIINLDVTLQLDPDPNKDPTALVKDAEVEQSDMPAVIVWRLKGANTANAKLTDLKWQPSGPRNPEPERVFSRFEPSKDGKLATMSDAHRDASTEGKWSYKLVVKLLNKRRECRMRKMKSNGGPGGSGNPNIKNN